ncbi:glycoside hydrolase family 99-like domain-containing protein [Nitrincola sp. MINF-07-Sa-05]|uniref:glycoside hydrolase family 99-like domain-containing protein n=1 Tax=Nitrincola salilacus TaxID=3400273 RepID=UPI003917C438
MLSRQNLLNEVLFDAQWYEQNYPDVAHSGLSPEHHYLSVGISLGRLGRDYAQGSALGKGNDAFAQGNYEDAIKYYVDAIGDDETLLPVLELNIRLCYDRQGIQASDAIILTRIKTALREQQRIRLDAALLQRPEWLDTYSYGRIIESGLFDLSYYREHNADVEGVEENPLAHYLSVGVEMGLNPSEHFDTLHYLKQYPDVAEAGVHPLIHYVCSGHKEGREPVPFPSGPYQSRYTVAEVEYIPYAESDRVERNTPVKVICFYLPQFHAIPENDEWWGKGFTEWTNVEPARSQFAGHYQPHVPHEDIGYYNLLDREAQAKQIELARHYGIEGFCYYLYWFSGERLLEQPLDNMLADKSLDFPFCVCWANENWSRRWDGLDHDLLMVQHYSDEDDIAFIQNIARYLQDERYIRIDGKPLLLIYRPNLFPSMKETATRWRDWCRDNGIGEIYLAYPQSFECADPVIYGFDAAIEFPPNNSVPPDITDQVEKHDPDSSSTVYDWRIFLERSDAYTEEGYKLFRGATPSWDNTARKKDRSTIFHNSCPRLFTQLLVNAFSHTLLQQPNPDERLVFVNAWNEWAEGAHLEPDQRYGYAWLKSVSDAHRLTQQAQELKVGIVIHAFYPDVLEEIMSSLEWLPTQGVKFYVTTAQDKEQRVREIFNAYAHDLHLEIHENKGRDVLPFLQLLPRVIEDGCHLLLKVHTKKSPHRVDGEQWRQDLYRALLSRGFYLKARSLFVLDPSVGLISPADHVVPLSSYWGSNSQHVTTLCDRLGIELQEVDDYEFVAGTMFMARVDMLSQVLQLGLGAEDFEPESGQVDGTLAHALERFFSIVCVAQGKTIHKYGERKDNTYKYAEVG